jgi:hypothetical protein
VADREPETLRGSWKLEEDEFTVTPDPMSCSPIWHVTFVGDTLTLLGAGGVYDFDRVGGPDPAGHTMALVR